jgi:hypothetical protein
VNSKLHQVLKHMIMNPSINRLTALTAYDVSNITDIIHRIRCFGIPVKYCCRKSPEFTSRFWFIPYGYKEGAYKVLQIIGD